MKKAALEIMPKRKQPAISPGKEELRKELKKKTSALERLKRELKIEASLERVRTSAMAMHTSEDLLNVCEVMYKELELLGVSGIRNAMINIHNSDSSFINYDYAGSVGKSLNRFSNNVLPFVGDIIKTGQSEGDAFSESHIVGKALSDFKKLRKNSAQKHDPRLNKAKGLYFYFYSIGIGSIGISTFAEITEEKKALLKRFRNVFTLSYQRYIDIANAEAQAREAQIEAALEKVRSRSLAVQKSEEFGEVVTVVFEKLHELRLPAFSASINITIDGSRDFKVYGCGVSDAGLIALTYRLPYFNHPVLDDLIQAHQMGVNRFRKTYFFEEKNSFYEYEFVHSGLKNLPADVKGKIFESRDYTITAALAKNSMILINDFDGQAFDEKQFDILNRFSRVFEQAYTRFLDLQKAEAQAREAKIEAALEKVRSRSLAMHKSDELQDVINTVHERLLELDVKMDSTCFFIFYEGTRDVDLWLGAPGNIYVSRMFIPEIDYAPTKDIFDARDSGNDFFTITCSFEEKNRWLNYAFEHTDLKQSPPERRRLLLGAKCWTLSVAISKHSAVVLNSYSRQSFSDEENDIVKRFGKVFEQAYVRFLDLQKAEAQARESQIQLALERVRARTMAMQKSEELAETSELLFEQINALGIQPWSCGFNIWQENDTYFMGYNPGPDGKIGAPLPLPLREDVFFKTIYDAKKSGEVFFVFESGGESLAQTYRYMDTLPVVGDFMRSIVASGFELPKYQVTHCGFFPQGHLMFITLEPHPEAWDIFKRFTKVFEQTYTRFLDLQKAEEQAREAEIELALERVRSKAMAMHTSGDILSTTTTAFEELKKLGIHSIRCGIGLLSKNSMEAQVYASTADSNGVFQTLVGVRDMNEHPSLTRQYQSWLKQENRVEVLEDEDLKSYYAKLFFQSSAISAPPQNFDNKEYGYYFSFADGLFYSWSNQEYTEYEVNILNRFKAIVALTFRRFLDLQKAEAQARESQIQLALERVRARTMAMHKSSEITSIAVSLNEELWKLGLQIGRQGGTSILIIDKETGDTEWWTGFSEDKTLKSCYVPYFQHPCHDAMMNAWKKGENFLTYTSVGPEKKSLDDHYFATGFKDFPESDKRWMRRMESLTFSFAFMKYGAIHWAPEPLTEEQLRILGRFSKVFEQSYTRFLDLQRAEAQAREAQIEAALEKVRSRSLAMHHTSELSEVVNVIFGRLHELSVATGTASVSLIDIVAGSKDVICWVASPSQASSIAIYVPFYEPMMAEFFADKESQGDYLKIFSKEQKNNYLTYLFDNTDFKYITDERKKFMLGSESMAVSAAFTKNGAIELYDYTGKLPPEEEREIMKRFAKVFDQAYTRFLDLQRAEAQTREAQIEAALERVRSRTMAMHKSEEIADIVAKIFSELRSLDLVLNRVLIWIFNDDERYISWWSANPEVDNVADSYRVDYNDQPVFLSYLQAWQKRIPLHLYALSGEEKRKWEDHLFSKTEMARLPVAVREGMRAEGTIFTASTISDYGLMMVGSFEPLSNENTDIIQRFGRVFQQSYTRYLDVQKAEAQAKEAIKRASVDRVRAEIASMRTTKDLERITPLIWNELTTLAVPFIRCGVFIMDEEKQQMDTHLSTPGGEAIATFKLAFNAPGEPAQILAHWREKEPYKQHWNEAQFVQFTQNLVQQGAVSSGEKYLLENRPTDLYLHFLPFLQGMLYVGNTSPLSDHELQLTQNLADAFSTAYARYDDFNRLEVAKKQVDSTLTELQATQKQLIQSEKMASLGELTAGIAHEIQNPLNFVNNFSEVNNELIEELQGERSKVKGERNEETENEILNNIKHNTDKIIHHGKRADSIVKGMLQHSRTTSATKELTEINALADEYLRLAYHGLRAKDKSFNATIQTDFDETIGKINIIPQDIGRVLLNLYGNAFYAVNENVKAHLDGGVHYEPKVTVTTKQSDGKILISVKDNGNGIPQKVVDKIFQPFFTTKPTGQGTGLGLSLAYDIVTAHGGEIKVNTSEGEGSEFVIQLPVTSNFLKSYKPINHGSD